MEAVGRFTLHVCVTRQNSRVFDQLTLCKSVLPHHPSAQPAVLRALWKEHGPRPTQPAVYLQLIQHNLLQVCLWPPLSVVCSGVFQQQCAVQVVNVLVCDLHLVMYMMQTFS